MSRSELDGVRKGRARQIEHSPAAACSRVRSQLCLPHLLPRGSMLDLRSRVGGVEESQQDQRGGFVGESLLLGSESAEARSAAVRRMVTSAGAAAGVQRATTGQQRRLGRQVVSAVGCA